MLLHVGMTDVQSVSIKLGNKLSAFTSLICFNRIHYIKGSSFIAILQFIKHYNSEL